MPNNSNYYYKPLLKIEIKNGQQYLKNIESKNFFPSNEELKIFPNLMGIATKTI